MKYSLYFQAYATKELCWMLSATLKYCEYVAFDRTLDKEKSIFEFFVTSDLEDVFLDIMRDLKKQGVIKSLQKMPNRLESRGNLCIK